MKLRIKEVLKEQKKTIVGLAAAIGKTQPYINDMVNGKSTPSLDTLDSIANYLDVPITELFDCSGSTKILCPHCGKTINIKVE